MPVLDLCKKEFVSINSGATLQFAAQLMKKNHVGSLVVIESNGMNKPVGILTDRDIVLSVVADNLASNTRVHEVMSTDVVTVPSQMGIAEVVERMESKAVRRVIVVDKHGNACGIVSLDDVVQLIAREMNGMGNLIERQLQKESLQKPFMQKQLTV